ncbi:MAG: aldolase catalytic domain-containing protein [Clostridiaceae bacterium]|nr:aldolase catalytic domain-containing protein [Clostridiaceae bacterium]
MKHENVKVLDCTLRDGGYANNWNFDDFNIKRIMTSLYKSGTDIIECGYIRNNSSKEQDTTIFKNISSVNKIIQETKIEKDFNFVAMIDYGSYKAEELEKADLLKGIRLAFHKKDWKPALEEAEKIMQKGYKVFIQPMVTLSYTDEELLELIREVNKLDVYAFYIVDSFGAMRKEDLIRMSYIVNHNLRKDIEIGFHGHNNLQLAYSNAIELLNLSKDRKIIIDCAVFGMGRGAGNLTTELFLNYLIENLNKNYKIEPLLDIIDKYLYRIYRESYWGYSMAHYLSAIYNCHPNYSNYLVSKKTLSISNMEEILKKLDKDKKVTFDKEYIEKLYIEFNSSVLNENSQLINFKTELIGKDVYLIAPGKSMLENASKVNTNVNNKIFISINHASNEIDSHYYFFSNYKRYTEFLEKINNGKILEKNRKFIFTSNIKPIDKHKDSIFVNYNSILGNTADAKDNSMVMLLNLLYNMKVDEVFIAGFDGYAQENSYLEENMEYKFSNNELMVKNKEIIKELAILEQKMGLVYVTPSIYEEYLLKKQSVIIKTSKTKIS